VKRNAENEMLEVGFDGTLFWEKYQGGSWSVQRILQQGIYVQCWCTFTFPTVKVSDTKSRDDWKGLQ
jgi:hypothetical protein